MPTIEEIRRQAELEGVGQGEINRRIAEAQTAGTLTIGEPTMERIKATMPRRKEAGLSLVGEKLFGEGWTEEGERMKQITPTFRTPEEQAAGMLPYQVGQQEEYQPPEPEVLQRREGAFAEPIQPGPAMPPVQPGIQLPKVAVPSVRGLQKAIEAVPEAYQKAEGALTEAFRKKRGAIGEWEETEKEAARAEAGVLEARQTEYEALQARQHEREQERQDYISSEMVKLRDAVTNLRSAKVDPTRFYRHPDGSANYPKTIAAAVAIGLGALGSTLPARYGGGGPNVALQLVDKAIDRDIQAQRDDIANQRAGVGLQMNLLSQMRGMYADERKAELATKVAMLESYKMQLETTSARSGDERVANRAAMLVAETDQKQAQILGDIEIASAKEHVLGEKELLGARQRTAALKQAQVAQQAKAATAAAGPTAFPGARILSEKYVPNKEDEKAAKPMVAAWREASKQLNDLIRWRAKYGAEVLNRAELATANTKLQRLKSAMRKVDETGARLDAGEIEMMGLDFSMGGAGWITERLTAVRDSVRDKISSRIHVHGYALEDQPTGRARRR